MVQMEDEIHEETRCQEDPDRLQISGNGDALIIPVNGLTRHQLCTAG